MFGYKKVCSHRKDAKSAKSDEGFGVLRAFAVRNLSPRCSRYRDDLALPQKSFGVR